MQYKKIYDGISSPSVAEHFLKRPHVDDLFRRAFKKPLTTVVAGAGYGKTQAVLSALSVSDCKFAWVQLSESDNNVSAFWERFTYSFKAQNEKLYSDLRNLDYPEMIVAFERFLCLLSRELLAEKRFILVFDDFHLISNKSILNFFEMLVSSGLKNFSIVLISRIKPKINMAGMLSKGLLSRINESDLRFSKEEMLEYFHKQGICFSEKMYYDIYNYVDGWIFAIYLIGLIGRKGNEDSINPILTAKIDIFNLLEEEIFSVLSLELQNLLIRISVLDVIPAGLLKELTNNNFSLISEMTQTSLLIQYDSVFDCYRIHHLFKEFLQDRRAWFDKDEFISIYIIAAKWYEKKGHKPEAISYYKESGCYNEIFDILLCAERNIPKETGDFYIRLIDEAPLEIIKARPIMRVVRARYMFNNNRIYEAKRELLSIREEYEVLPESEENKAVLGEAYVILGFISIVNQDYEFEELFRKAAECLPNGSKIIDNKVNVAEGLNVCSIKSPAAGELKRHRDALFNVTPYAESVLNGCGYGTEKLNAAEASLYVADLKEAESYAYEAIFGSRQYAQYDIEYMANFVLLRIFTAKGNYKKAFELLNQLEERLEAIQNTLCVLLNDVIHGWFYVKIGYTEKIAKWIKHEEEAGKVLAPVHLGREYLVRSDCLLAEEKYYELLAYMKKTDKIYETRGILFAVIQNKITKAIIYHYIGNHEESIKALNEAYELSHPNDLIMQFIEYGNKMRTLIHAARLNKNCTIPRKWLDNIYKKSSSYAKQVSQLIFDYNAAHMPVNTELINLSKRETEVLTYLSRGLTREEIADSCYLSVSSINSTIKNVYDKLGATNIADAVRIAKEKNFL